MTVPPRRGRGVEEKIPDRERGTASRLVSQIPANCGVSAKFCGGVLPRLLHSVIFME